MLPPEAAPSPNQIAFDFMSEGPTTQARIGAVVAARYAPVVPGRGFVSVVAGVSALGMVILALASSSASEPLLLTILSTLAMFGVFFLFGILAGHIRVGDRLEASDFARAIPEGLDNGVLVTARDGTPLYNNRMLIEFTGRTPSGEAATFEAAFGSDAQAREALFRLSRAAERGDRHREDIRLPAALAGLSRVLSIETMPFDMGTRRETGPLSLWTVCDVTEQRQREATARQSLHDVLAHYESAPVGLIAAGRDGHVQHMNATLARWLGHTPGPRSPHMLRLSDILSADAIQLLDSAWREGAADLITLDVDATREDGRLLPVQVVARAGRDGSRLLGLMNRERESHIARADGAGDVRFDRFFQSAPFGIASVSADGRITSANSAFARLLMDATGGLNKAATEVLCRTADRLTRSSVEDSLKQVLAGRASPQPVEITVGGEREQVRRVFISPLSTFGNAREAAVLYVIDATEQKALEAQYAQSSKMEAVGKLAGGIAHDFNNVLTAIIGFSDLLLQTHRTSDPAYKDIKNIQQSAYRAAGMVRQLLSFSRRQTLQAEPLQLDEVLAESASMLRTSVGEKIALKIQPSRDLWHDLEPHAQRQRCDAGRRRVEHPQRQHHGARQPEA
jgi:two-component system, cell cycle sensor histidine kinase and response regulator CckA